MNYLVLSVVILAAIAVPFVHSFSASRPAISNAINNGGVNCTFESGWCGWTMQTHTSYGWTRISGIQPHHQKGWYIIFNGTQNRSGHNAVIISPYINPSNSVCVDFWLSTYQMPGQVTNNFHMTLHSEFGTPTTVTFKENTKSNWIHKRIPFPSYKSSRLVLSATKEGNNNGYIGIDNIQVYPKGC